MKKKNLFSVLLALAVCAFLFAGCESNTPAVSEPEHEHAQYIAHGRYYLDYVETDDGNLWGYTQDTISEKESYFGEPVYVVFDDNGTPGNIYDDPILGLVLDTETAIYDALEESLSESFTIERSGNEIRIITGAENQN